MAKWKVFQDFNDSILMYRENYAARPVTVDKTTIAGLQPDENGKYYIPKGTFLGGAVAPLLTNPSQIAKQVVLGGTADFLDVAGVFRITAKQVGDSSLTFEMVEPTGVLIQPTITMTGTEISVTLAKDEDGVVTNYAEVVAMINSDMRVNSVVKAELTNMAKAEDIAAAFAEAMLDGGAAPGDETGVQVDGVLAHKVDVTDGAMTGALMIAGFVDLDKLPKEPSQTIKSKLPAITFMRKD